jgi:hypothetical protein
MEFSEAKLSPVTGSAGLRSDRGANAGARGYFPRRPRAPLREIVRVESDTEKIRGHEAELSRPNANEANDDAVQRGDDPAMPQLLPNEDRRDDREHARQIVEAKHGRLKLIDWSGLGDWSKGQVWRTTKLPVRVGGEGIGQKRAQRTSQGDDSRLIATW